MFGTEHNLSVNEQLLKNYLYLINNFTTHHSCKCYHWEGDLRIWHIRFPQTQRCRGNPQIYS